MSKQLDNLKDRIFRNKSSGTGLTGILFLIKELGCLSDVIGRDFEVLDSNGKRIYTIKQKPMTIKQTNVLMKELHILKKLENETNSRKRGRG